MTRAIVLLLLACVLPLPVAAADAPLPDAGAWKVVATDHFTVYSDADDTRTKQALRNLETLRAVLSNLSSGFMTRTAKPVYVYVFEKNASLKRYAGDVSKGSKELAGFHVTGPDRNVLAMSLAASANPAETLYHEYLHEVLAATFPKIPLWLNEGIAEYYTTFACGEGVAEIGRPVKSHVLALRNEKVLPVEWLIGVDGESPDYNEEDRAGAFYAQSWATVHWLMRGRPELRQRLAAYLGALLEGTASEEFWTAFDLTPETVDRELAAYVAQARFPYAEVTLRELSIPEIPAPRPMAAHEALASLGWLTLLTHDGDRADGERHFRAALERVADYAPAWSGLAWILSLRDKPDAAAAMFDRAVAADPKDPKIAFLAGMTALERELTRLGEGPNTLAPPTPGMIQARDLLGRALTHDPENALALAGYGATFAATEGDPALGVAALERAAARLPSESSVAINLAMLYIRTGERKKAESWIDRRVALVADPDELAQVREALLRFDVEEAQRLFRAGKETEAIALLRTIRSRTVDPGFAASLDGMIEKAEAASRRNRIVARYNAALEQARAGKTEEAKRQLAALAATCDGDTLCDDVRRTLEQLGASPARKKP